MTADQRLAEQIDYYRAVAKEYEDHTIDVFGGEQLVEAFKAFPINGDVLELACGTGTWTKQLVSNATTLTAVDASPEMIHRARQQVVGSSVNFVQADLFAFEPSTTYDSVFFGFWLSHVPEERFAAFWSMVERSLRPGGKVFFVDDNYRTDAELIEGHDSPIVERRLNDGTTFRAIKVPHEARDLVDRLCELGWNVAVGAAGPFYWGSGSHAGARTAD